MFHFAYFFVYLILYVVQSSCNNVDSSWDGEWLVSGEMDFSIGVYKICVI